MTDNEAAKLLAEIVSGLRSRSHGQVASDIELAVSEGVEQLRENHSEPRARRRASNREALEIAIGVLHKRLVVLPAVIDAIARQSGTNNVQWRADTEFVSPGQAQSQEGNLKAVPLDSRSHLEQLFEPLSELLPQERIR